MKPRSFQRLARLWSFVSRRERAAWNRATRGRGARAAERWYRVLGLVERCPRLPAVSTLGARKAAS